MRQLKYILVTSLILSIPCYETLKTTQKTLDEIAQNLTQTESLRKFTKLLRKVGDFRDVFRNQTVSDMLTGGQRAFHKKYIETLAATDGLVDIVNLPKSMVAVRSGDGSVLAMLTSLMDNIDVMKAVNQVDWSKYVLKSNGDDVVYIPGIPNGISVDCGIRFAKYFGHVLNSNVSIFDPTKNTGQLLKSPAAKMIDSWGRIPARLMSGNTHWLGAFEQCSTISTAKYCAVDMLVMGKYPGVYGTCMPKQCTEHDVASIHESVFNQQLELVIFVSGEDHTNCVEDTIVYSNGFIITITLCGFIALLIILGTFVDVMDVSIAPTPSSPTAFTNGRLPSDKTQEREQQHGENVKMMPLNDDDNDDGEESMEDDDVILDDGDTPVEDKEEKEKEAKTKSTILKILLCFSLARNARALLSTEVPKKAIQSINGIRALSMFWVILGHLLFFGTVAKNSDNPTAAVATLMRRFSYQPIANAYVSVDTFFLLSGLLMSYLSLRRMDKSGGRMNIPLLYLHRFLRITPPYMFVLLIWNNVFPYMFTGPLARATRQRGDGGQCSKYWWTNLLYINNFYPSEMGETVKDKTCLGWSWYLANDMQFHILAPVILTAFFFLEKRFKNTRFRHLGAFVITLTCCITCICIRMVLLSVHEFPGLISGGMLPDNPFPIGRRQDNLYVKPYARFSPYIIGMFLGYAFSRRITIRFHKKVLFTLGWIMAFGFGYAVVYGPYVSGYKYLGDHFNKTENVLYGSLNEFTWALAVAWVLYACHTGYAGMINKFLSWKFWIPLSRLTFGAYLLHPLVIFYFFLVHENPFHYQDNLMAFVYVSNLFFSYVVAFILAVGVEYPVLNLEKLLFKHA